MKIVFTGLVEALGRVIEVQSRPPGMRLVVDAGEVASDAVLGDSISVNGCCLTVVEIDGNKLAFDAGDETLKRTNLGRLGEADVVNLERSLQVGDRLGGHYVTGHIDGLGSLQQRNDDGEWSTCWFQVPPALTRQMASKGSVAIDGISLTLVDVEDDRFSVMLIPHTLAATTLGVRKVGDPVNIETDVLAKYVERQLAGRE